MRASRSSLAPLAAGSMPANVTCGGFARLKISQPVKATAAAVSRIKDGTTGEIAPYSRRFIVAPHRVPSPAPIEYVDLVDVDGSTGGNWLNYGRSRLLNSGFGSQRGTTFWRGRQVQGHHLRHMAFEVRYAVRRGGVRAQELRRFAFFGRHHLLPKTDGFMGVVARTCHELKPHHVCFRLLLAVVRQLEGRRSNL